MTGARGSHIAFTCIGLICHKTGSHHAHMHRHWWTSRKSHKNKLIFAASVCLQNEQNKIILFFAFGFVLRRRRIKLFLMTHINLNNFFLCRTIWAGPCVTHDVCVFRLSGAPKNERRKFLIKYWMFVAYEFEPTVHTFWSIEFERKRKWRGTGGIHEFTIDLKYKIATDWKKYKLWAEVLELLKHIYFDICCCIRSHLLLTHIVSISVHETRIRRINTMANTLAINSTKGLCPMKENYARKISASIAYCFHFRWATQTIFRRLRKR